MTDVIEAQDVLARVADRMEAEIRPLLEADKYDKPPGYNCCGCGTYDEILDHALRIVREEAGLNAPTPSEIHIITNAERRAQYGSCVVCGAPRDAYTVEWADARGTEVVLGCTATFAINAMSGDFGHPQD